MEPTMTILPHGRNANQRTLHVCGMIFIDQFILRCCVARFSSTTALESNENDSKLLMQDLHSQQQWKWNFSNWVISNVSDICSKKGFLLLFLFHFVMHAIDIDICSATRNHSQHTHTRYILQVLINSIWVSVCGVIWGMRHLANEQFFFHESCEVDTSIATSMDVMGLFSPPDDCIFV